VASVDFSFRPFKAPPLKVPRSRRNGHDDRELPRYGITEASLYLGVKLATLKTWTRGRKYPSKHGTRLFRPLIELPAPGYLSFFNLVEAHILLATRKKHNVPLVAVRHAMNYIAREYPSKHPLLTEEFYTDGKDLFVRKIEGYIDVSRYGQLGIGPVLDMYLKRIERDRSGLPLRLFPLRMDWIRRRDEEEPPKVIVIDPRISSGRPIVYGTGIITTILAGRFRSGEGVDELAQDYGLDKGQIEEAIRYAPAA